MLSGNPGDPEDSVTSGNPLFTESDVAEQLCRRESSALESSEFSLVVSDSSFLVYAWYGLISKSRRKYQLLMAGLMASVISGIMSHLSYCPGVWKQFLFSCFFAAGEAFRQRDGAQKLDQDKRLWIGSFNVFLLLGFVCGSVNLSCGNYGVSMLAYLLVGISGSIVILMLECTGGSEASKGIPSDQPGWTADASDPVPSYVCLHVYPGRSDGAGTA